MGGSGDETLRAFHWQPQPQPAEVFSELLGGFVHRCPAAAVLAARLEAETGTRLIDWIDHLVAGPGMGLLEQLIAAGFINRGAPGVACCYVRPDARFPALVLEAERTALEVAVVVESLGDFLAAHGLAVPIAGAVGAAFRQARIGDGDHAGLSVVERQGSAGFLPGASDPVLVAAVLRHGQALRSRRRDHRDLDEAFAALERLLDEAIAALGRDRACALFFATEREFWQARNHAARVQAARQAALGLGWANHDHHTYRSSRACFTRLIALFEKLGFHCRERFHPGAGAGWGAQVLEHPASGVVIFADVDMSPQELRSDFAHQPFADQAAGGRPLGTVGLWCALHGESLFAAGLHHLACRVDFTASRTQLEQCGVASMPPFSTYPHLQQCFTAGERWPVDETRLAGLLASGQLDAAQAAGFRSAGALGSHLELVERNDGFKGFNQHGVDDIIASTDPRRQG